MTREVRCALALALCLGAATPRGAAAADTAVDTAFAYDFSATAKKFTTFPVGNPASMSPVGPQADSMRAIDFDPGATVLWAINFTSQTVGTIDQSTGAYTSGAALQGGCCISALTIDPVRGTFYVSKSDAFVYELDPLSGVSVLVAQGTPAGTQIQALSMSCSGRLVAAEGDAVDQNLYDVDLNGTPTLIGSPGYLGATSIEFDNQTGTLYGWFNPASGDTSTHVTLDTASGQASSATQLSGRFRMAIRNTCTAEQLRIFADGYEG